jgi:hypothetical protein
MAASSSRVRCDTCGAIGREDKAHINWIAGKVAGFMKSGKFQSDFHFILCIPSIAWQRFTSRENDKERNRLEFLGDRVLSADMAMLVSQEKLDYTSHDLHVSDIQMPPLTS